MRNLVNKSILLLSLTISISSFSQDKKNVDVTDVFKINFFDPGISYEKRIGQQQTLYGKAFLSTSVFIGYSSSLGNMSSVDIYPALGLQYRYYYNGNKRASRDKRTDMNSMNYVAVVTEASFYKDNSYNLDKSRIQKIFGAAWGFQRNYAKRFSLDLNLGIGYSFNKRTVYNYPDSYSDIAFSEFTTLGQISLGFWLNKRE